jgi:hypothetical protein
MDIKRKAREHAIAAEIADELHNALGPVMMPEALTAKNGDIVRETFGRVFDRHHVVSEAVAARILKHVPKVLAAHNAKFAELHCRLDAAVRQQRATT